MKPINSRHEKSLHVFVKFIGLHQKATNKYRTKFIPSTFQRASFKAFHDKKPSPKREFSNLGQCLRFAHFLKRKKRKSRKIHCYAFCFIVTAY